MVDNRATRSAGLLFGERLVSNGILPLIGVYDMFSARIVASRFEGVFCSGFGFAASHHGLPDIGYVTWRDIVDYATRMRAMLSHSYILVDIDDGFGDETIASNTVALLEKSGVSAVMMEDQKRPRRCGHTNGKQVLSVDEYLVKLSRVLETREEMFVIARTDAMDPRDGLERAAVYAREGADAVMVEAVRSLDLIRELRTRIECPIMVNQMYGGKSPNWSLEELEEAGVSLVIYSTPCLFAAQQAIEAYLDAFEKAGKLPGEGTSTMAECNAILNDDLHKR